MLLVNALRNVNPKTRIRLTIPYFPFARQDRVMTEGEPFALQVATNLINSCNFDEIEIWDAHSDVLAGMFPPGKLRMVPQWNLMESTIKYIRTENSCLVSPDAGALKKIYKLAKIMNMPVIEASKVRDVSTGEIKSTKIDPDAFWTTYDKLFVVDDICDGGRTFIELGNEIRKHYQGELILVVTHGIFSKGREVFDGLYNQVVALNNMDKED
jgi:ribose-phosphate pyrophosphokinase